MIVVISYNFFYFIDQNLYLQFVFTRYTIGKFDVVWLVGGGSHPMAAPREVITYSA